MPFVKGSLKTNKLTLQGHGESGNDVTMNVNDDKFEMKMGDDLLMSLSKNGLDANGDGVTDSYASPDHTHLTFAHDVTINGKIEVTELTAPKATVTELTAPKAKVTELTVDKLKYATNTLSRDAILHNQSDIYLTHQRRFYGSVIQTMIKLPDVSYIDSEYQMKNLEDDIYVQYCPSYYSEGTPNWTPFRFIKPMYFYNELLVNDLYKVKLQTNEYDEGNVDQSYVPSGKVSVLDKTSNAELVSMTKDLDGGIRYNYLYIGTYNINATTVLKIDHKLNAYINDVKVPVKLLKSNLVLFNKIKDEKDVMANNMDHSSSYVVDYRYAGVDVSKYTIEHTDAGINSINLIEDTTERGIDLVTKSELNRDFIKYYSLVSTTDKKLPTLDEITSVGKFRYSRVTLGNELDGNRYIDAKIKSYSMSAPGYHDVDVDILIDYNKDVYAKNYLGAELSLCKNVYNVNMDLLKNDIQDKLTNITKAGLPWFNTDTFLSNKNIKVQTVETDKGTMDVQTFVFETSLDNEGNIEAVPSKMGINNSWQSIDHQGDVEFGRWLFKFVEDKFYITSFMSDAASGTRFLINKYDVTRNDTTHNTNISSGNSSVYYDEEENEVHINLKKLLIFGKGMYIEKNVTTSEEGNVEFYYSNDDEYTTDMKLSLYTCRKDGNLFNKTSLEYANVFVQSDVIYKGNPVIKTECPKPYDIDERSPAVQKLFPFSAVGSDEIMLEPYHNGIFVGIITTPLFRNSYYGVNQKLIAVDSVNINAYASSFIRTVDGTKNDNMVFHNQAKDSTKHVFETNTSNNTIAPLIEYVTTRTGLPSWEDNGKMTSLIAFHEMIHNMQFSSLGLNYYINNADAVLRNAAIEGQAVHLEMHPTFNQSNILSFFRYGGYIDYTTALTDSTTFLPVDGNVDFDKSSQKELTYQFCWFYNYFSRFDKTENGVRVPEFIKRVMQKQMELTMELGKPEYRTNETERYDTDLKVIKTIKSNTGDLLNREKVVSEIPTYFHRNLFSEVISELKSEGLTDLSNVVEYYKYIVLSMHSFLSYEDCDALGISRHYGQEQWVLDLISAENADKVFENRTLEEVADLLKAISLEHTENILADKMLDSALTIDYINSENLKQIIAILARPYIKFSQGITNAPYPVRPTDLAYDDTRPKTDENGNVEYDENGNVAYETFTVPAEVGNTEIELEPFSSTYLTYGAFGKKHATHINLTSTGACKLIFFEKEYGTTGLFMQEHDVTVGENSFELPSNTYLKIFIFNYDLDNKVDIVVKDHVSLNVFKINGETPDMARGYLALSGPTSFQYAYAKAELIHHEDADGNALLGDSAAEFTETGVEGKIVLVSRGAHYFSDKIIRAQEAGAVGCIIYNNIPGAGPISMAWGSYPPIVIPNFMIGNTEGKDLVERLQSGESISVEVGFDCVLYDTNKGVLLNASEPPALPPKEFEGEISANSSDVHLF